MWGSLVGILVTPFPAYCQDKDPSSCSSSFRNLVFFNTHRFPHRQDLVPRRSRTTKISHHEIGITKCIFPFLPTLHWVIITELRVLLFATKSRRPCCTGAKTGVKVNRILKSEVNATHWRRENCSWSASGLVAVVMPQ